MPSVSHEGPSAQRGSETGLRSNAWPFSSLFGIAKIGIIPHLSKQFPQYGFIPNLLIFIELYIILVILFTTSRSLFTGSQFKFLQLTCEL